MSSEHQLIQIIYVSTAPASFDEATLRRMLEQFRQANERFGISGLLLYDGGNFIQVIEGPEAAVEHLFANIQADKRHRQLILLRRQAIELRDFPSWTMGYHHGDVPIPDAGFSDVLAHPESLPSNDPHRILWRITAFREGRWHPTPAARHVGAAG